MLEAPSASARNNHSHSKGCLLRDLRKHLYRARGHPVPDVPTAFWIGKAANHNKKTRVRIDPALQAAGQAKQTPGHTRSRNRRSAARPEHSTTTERHLRMRRCRQRIVRQIKRRVVRSRHARDYRRSSRASGWSHPREAMRLCHTRIWTKPKSTTGEKRARSSTTPQNPRATLCMHSAKAKMPRRSRREKRGPGRALHARPSSAATTDWIKNFV